MTLLLCVLVVATILLPNVKATPPIGYVKDANNDEHPPSYRYKYEVEDNLGDRHGKTEVREGEHARGRYFVNSKQASTDVKYIVDEWGYHPVVKYDTANDHSSTSARFAIGEKAVADLDQENNSQPPSFFLPKEDERTRKRINRPNKTENSTTEKLILNKFSNDTSATLNQTESLSQDESKSVIGNFLSANYITFNPQSKNSEPESFGNEIHFVTNYQIPITQQHQQQVSSTSNNLVSNVAEENKLIVETAGSFGQRLHTQDGLSTFITTTVSTSPVLSDVSVSLNNTRNERILQEKTREKINNQYLPDTVPGLGAYSTTTAPSVDESVTITPIGSDITDIPVRISNNGGVDGPEARIFSSLSSKTAYGISGTTLNPLLINYASQGILSSTLKTVDSTFFGKKEHTFSKPIVVPDVPNEKPFQYSTTFVCEDDNISHTPNPLDFHEGTFADTTSSHILNSIQAGVSLVNAGETHLIGKSKEALPAPVMEHVEELPQADQAAQLTNSILTPRDNYIGINPAFGGPHDDPKARQRQQILLQQQQQQQLKKIEQQQLQQHSQSQKNQAVEIQKSIELHTSSPSLEIHYPNQLAIPQITYGNQQQQLQSRNDQKQDFTSDAIQNTKQTITSQTKSDVIIENYSKNSVNDQPVYVVAPATYILEESNLKTNLLQEATPQDHSLKTNAAFRPREQPQNEMLNTGTLEHQRNIAVPPEINVKSLLDKTSHVPHLYSVEKSIEKKVPYRIEKIIEKRIPVPHPYPVPVQVPVPQPIPIHIEKVIERKVPVHIPIPQIYSVEKPVHIPVPIEKIIEKPVHIPITVEKIIEKKVPVPQPYPIEIEKVVETKIPYPIEVNKYMDKSVALHTPYGVKYGVSYQQIMKPQNHGLYTLPSNSLAPLYALSSLSTNNLYSSSVNNLNRSQPFEGYIYEKPVIPFVEGKENVDLNFKTPVNKIPYNSYTLPNYPISNNLLHRRHGSIHRSNKPERDDYSGPVPPLQHLQRQFGFQSKSLVAYPFMSDRMQGSRKSRNQEPIRYQKGNFRQSKIEYGFKPPMVPSVQYDEETASKVES